VACDGTLSARPLEKALQTPARIYYKYEGVSPAGSHKPNTAVAQAFYNKEAGIKKITTETGAGQWVRRWQFAGALFGIDCRCSWCACRTPEAVSACVDGDLRRTLHRQSVQRDPVTAAAFWKNAAEQRQPRHRDFGSGRGRGKSRRHKYALGSCSITCCCIDRDRQEAMAQLELAGDYPDIIIAAPAAGPNFSGIVFPFLGSQLRGGAKVRIIAIEPSACPSLTRGRYATTSRHRPMTPLAKMHSSARHSCHRVSRRRAALSRHGAAGIATSRT